MRDFDAGGAFVLGGSGGLGSAVGTAFARAGVPVAFSYNSDSAAADRTAADIRKLGVRATFCQLDSSDRAGVFAALNAAADELGGLHSVVYAGGASFTPEFFSRTEESVWQDWLKYDVMGALNLAQAALPHLRASKGAFTALSTYQGDMIEVRGAPSAIAKGAVDRMVKVIAKEEGRFGVRANTLRCGWIGVDGVERLFEMMPHLREGKRKTVPLGRVGHPEEVGETIVFLSSRRAGYITGQNITADGGESL
ncbi:MAG: SDR family oxidoreductase [Sphingomonadaceae bacterium]|nr:SDR family oxidoreductase [Sphingomonadaceae bacterium]